MIEVQFLVPLADNTGQVFRSEHHDAFAAELTRLFGGCSALRGVVAGQWVDAGRVYFDQNRVYAVFIPGLLEAGALVMTAIAFAKIHYAQLKIGVRYLGHAEIL
jgi:hypothetical protein